MAFGLYEVPIRNNMTTTMQLSDEDAEAFRERDGLDIKKVGSIAEGERQPVTAPPHAVDEDGKPLPESKQGTVRERARKPLNKSASPDDK